jgi:predicted ABC-type ATPase
MNIYLVAGPPGIGKSTYSRELIPVDVPIIDQDLAAYQYKKRGFENYQDIATMATNQRIRQYLFDKESFALELNLGFESHYAYLKSIASFDWSNKITILLFFTDSVDLCLDRAQIRFENGGHEVNADIIEEMYSDTFSLFEQNKNLFHRVRLVNVTYDSVLELTKESKPLPKWVSDNNLEIYL